MKLRISLAFTYLWKQRVEGFLKLGQTVVLLDKSIIFSLFFNEYSFKEELTYDYWLWIQKSEF